MQTLPGSNEPFDDRVGNVAGFSLHAGVAARANERKKLVRLCRYISRPAVSEKRMSLTPNGNVRYQLKTPYRDGISLQDWRHWYPGPERENQLRQEEITEEIEVLLLNASCTELAPEDNQD
ncbi:hypothetical protein FHS09_000909 [Microbulbifer rhizosphaerae]|uniref:Transposase IS801/IS1294 domain-containing protein n=1 Tax=Microbulbifer rhizosphaerae TaxID=1562603 RepID=A0A7W4WAN6_9GAMM|nr:hypothetical protein [Microbulbifer rhizosphaerae]